MSASQIGLILIIACVVAIVSRRLRLPYSVGLVAAGVSLAALGGALNLVSELAAGDGGGSRRPPLRPRVVNDRSAHATAASASRSRSPVDGSSSSGVCSAA